MDDCDRESGEKRMEKEPLVSSISSLSDDERKSVGSADEELAEPVETDSVDGPEVATDPAQISALQRQQVCISLDMMKFGC